MAKHLWKSGSLAVALSLMLSSMAPVAYAAPAEQPSPSTPEIQDTPTETAFSAFNRLPSVEPGVVGTFPIANSGLAVAGVQDGAALVRLSAFATDTPVEISAAGTPVLQVAAGHEGSTTVLVPVQNGKIPVFANTDAQVRVEVLASFGSDTQTPGATLALAEAVTRADSVNDLGLQSLTTDPQTISVVGVGGVPSQGVRAVYVTANVQLDAAGTLTISGQELELPAGQSIVTTVALVDDEGFIDASSNVAGDIRIDVSGWVVGSTQNMSSANATGSFVPSAQSDWEHTNVSPDNSKDVTVSGHSGRQQALALVSAESSAEKQRAFVNVGDPAAGRSKGILVDPSKGALPQIELVEASSASASVSVQGSTVDVNVLALGDIVAHMPPAQGSTELDIEAPTAVDLAVEGEIVLTGSLTSDAPVDKVEVFGNDTYIGTASVQYTQNGATWTFRTGAPESGEANFSAKALARDGSSATAQTAVEVTLPEEDDIVISPELVILDTEEIQTYTEGTFLFEDEQDLTPGDVLVADASEQTPEGALRRVISIQQVPEGWSVRTEQAALTDVFLQAHDESSMPAFTEGTELIAPEDDQGFEILDDGVENVQLVVDEDASSAAELRSKLSAPAASSGEMMLALHGVVSLGVSAEKKFDSSRGNRATKQLTEQEIKRAGGVALEASIKASLGLETGLDIDIRWAWGIPRPELTYFKSSFKGGVEASYKISASGSYTEEFTREIAELKGAPVTVAIGPVPIVFIPGATLSAVASLEAQLSLSYEDGINPTFEYGVEYRDGSWNPINNPQPSDSANGARCVGWGDGISAAGDVSGQGGLELAADVKLFGFAGPEATISAQGRTAFGIELDGSEEKLTGSATREMVLGAGLNVDAKFDILGTEVGTSWELLGIERIFPISEDQVFEFDLCDNEELSPNPDEGEPDQEDPVDSILNGTVVDAATNEPMSGVNIHIEDGDGQTHTVTSAQDGSYSVTLAYGDVTVEAEAEGYIPYSRVIGVNEGATETHDIQLSRELTSTQYRAVLTWGENPRDLDSHLIGSDLSGSYHVFYGDKTVYNYELDKYIAELDVDDVDSYGPETTTFDVNSAGDYSFFVHNYSETESLATSDAHVTLYQGNSKIADIDVPAGSDELYWNVFRIQNGELKILNTLSAAPDLGGIPVTATQKSNAPSITEKQLTEALKEVEAGTK